MKEPLIIINGRNLNIAQSTTLLFALSNLSIDLCDDDHPCPEMAKDFRARIEEIKKFIRKES